MGKSDNQIFPVYLSMIEKKHYESIAFLGFSQENEFTKKISGKERDFFDISLGNWNINENWDLNRKYDLIVCTRCAYFSRDPKLFIQKCKYHLNQGGHALIDWGLGDHWRFSNYKIGWIKDDEHEFAYGSENFLYSCFWRDSLSNDAEVKNFWKAVIDLNVGYNQRDDISSVVTREVPKIVDYETISLKTKFLWKDCPQLYIITWI